VEAAAEAAGVFAFAEAAGMRLFNRSASMMRLYIPPANAIDTEKLNQQQQVNAGDSGSTSGTDGLEEEEEEEEETEETDSDAEYKEEQKEEKFKRRQWENMELGLLGVSIGNDDYEAEPENEPKSKDTRPRITDVNGEVVIDPSGSPLRPRRTHKKTNRDNKKSDNNNNNNNNNKKEKQIESKINGSLGSPPIQQSNNEQKQKTGLFQSWFSCVLPYAFPRAYPEDNSDDEEGPVRPPPIIPHKSGPHSSHPILDQEIEARGQNISGGFAQSIALARIFVRPETKILILDEAMSQMDAYKKREIIFPKLFEFTRKNDIALIIITHDLLSIQDVDHVFVLDQGRLEHQGTHKELLEQKAPGYMRLLGC